MTIAKSTLSTAINTVLDSEVLDRVVPRLSPRMTADHPLPRRKGKSVSGKALPFSSRGATPYLKGQKPMPSPDVFRGNIENFYGCAQIPVGMIGPLRVNGIYSHDDVFVPLATTEGALVASYDRGARVISLSGGATVMCLTDMMTRVPGFVFNSVVEAARFVAWCSEIFSDLKAVAEAQTRYGRLVQLQFTLEGNYAFVHFQFTTGEAAGQNMVTIATDAVCSYIMEFAPVKPRRWYIESNLSGDKKASCAARLLGRGKRVTAEVVIPASLVRKFLRTTPERIVEYSRLAMSTGFEGGATGSQGHVANALAALFLATGQDVACVVESAVGQSRAEVTETGDLYATVSLPNLIVGTVGGGTGLPTQRECLDLMGCSGSNSARKLAEICAATVLAGEISIAAAIAAGEFTRAHVQYGRPSPSTSSNCPCPETQDSPSDSS